MFGQPPEYVFFDLNLRKPYAVFVMRQEYWPIIKGNYQRWEIHFKKNIYFRDFSGVSQKGNFEIFREILWEKLKNVVMEETPSILQIVCDV